MMLDVPATDLLNMHREPLLYAICREEYCDALVETERPWLEAYDPIANAKPADYPATLVIAGANDPRCPASQARLFADELGKAQTGARGDPRVLRGAHRPRSQRLIHPTQREVPVDEAPRSGTRARIRHPGRLRLDRADQRQCHERRC